MRTTNKILLVALGAALAFAMGRSSVGGTSTEEEHADHALPTDAGTTLWTCPMHPQIKLPEFGDCPICGMDLVEMVAGGEDDDPRRMALSPAARELAGIETVRVPRKNVTRPVRMVGKVDYDETIVRTISARVPGRLDRLFVDYTGVPVVQGDHLVWLYSPDLLTAQEELLSTRGRLSTAGEQESEFLARSDRRAYDTAREKLLLLGLTEEQVAEIEERGTAEDHVMLTSPSSGVVIDKRVDEGAYVQTGTPIYRIADLSRLWIMLDAYEQDLPWLRYGQRVVLEMEALPGQSFEGVISYVDPYIHEHTRTAKVRVNIDNPRGDLKPGMFVCAVAMSRIGGGGVVIDRDLAGKWVSPMHPEIVKEGPGACDVCGMDLVPAEDLGLVEDAPDERPLVVPSSAVLVTGKRAVVYVEVPDAERPTYEGREVVLGPRAGDEYIVMAGLEEGERVVIQGAFRIDSAMQIQAKPSMMSLPGDEGSFHGPEAEVFRQALVPLVEGYLVAQESLAADEEQAAREAMASLLPLLEVPGAGLPAGHRIVWSEEQARIRAAAQRVEDAKDLESLRGVFEDLSQAVRGLVNHFGHSLSGPLREVHCPMAFDNAGASWLQAESDVQNPYFGASMLRCGDVQEVFPSTGRAPEVDPHAGHDHGSAPASEARADGDSPLSPVFRGYLAVQEDLADDRAEEALEGMRALLEPVLAATGGAGLDPEVTGHLHTMHGLLLEPEPEIEALRERFHEISKTLLALTDAAGNPLGEELQVAHCPMAFDFEGADWLQLGDTIANPYFGESMLRCGSVQRSVEVR